MMMTTMTVREALLFSARLRLPASVSLADKRDQVDKVRTREASRAEFVRGSHGFVRVLVRNAPGGGAEGDAH